MKCLLCYFSGSGNTKLACEYLTRKITEVTFDLYDITSETQAQFDTYDIVGFACFADFLGPSKRMISFINSLPKQSGKYAFVFNTFGNFNGATSAVLQRLVTKKGFDVIAGHALHMPENIPNMIMMGLANTQAPDEKEMAAFTAFIDRMNALVTKFKAGDIIQTLVLPLGERILFPIPRFAGKMMMGRKMIDTEKCTQCGICVRKCPYGAMRMETYPCFDEQKCGACWVCYNHCPSKAIYTKHFRGVAHYPEPIDEVKKKLTTV